MTCCRTVSVSLHTYVFEIMCVIKVINTSFSKIGDTLLIAMFKPPQNSTKVIASWIAMDKFSNIVSCFKQVYIWVKSKVLGRKPCNWCLYFFKSKKKVSMLVIIQYLRIPLLINKSSSLIWSISIIDCSWILTNLDTEVVLHIAWCGGRACIVSTCDSNCPCWGRMGGVSVATPAINLNLGGNLWNLGTP